MKPPLTVEAKVAEELRNWLASELEQLDASNTNQFAHHVVTILLHEDLDIEDEPLTTGDDFLRDIYSIKKGKTRDKQKKAAVQFLRNAVCCDDPGEAEIQGVVDELMVKIEETKSKMNNKKSTKRSLLAPIAINIETSANKPCVKSDGSEDERRYNEAFPSLSGEESPSREGLAHLNSNNNSVWNRSPPVGKENKKKLKRKLPQQTSRQLYMFSSQAEAQACSTARQSVALVLRERTFPKAEAAEVFPPTSFYSSSSSFFARSGCWRSRFYRYQPTREIFSPTTDPLVLIGPFTTGLIPKVFSPAVLIRGGKHHTETLDPPPSHLIAQTKLLSRIFRPIHDSPTPRDEADREVTRIIEAFRERVKQIEETVENLSKSKHEVNPDKGDGNWTTEIEGALAFPSHYGCYWDYLARRGIISLYPDLSGYAACCCTEDARYAPVVAYDDPERVLSLLGTASYFALGSDLFGDRESRDSRKEVLPLTSLCCRTLNTAEATAPGNLRELIKRYCRHVCVGVAGMIPPEALCALTDVLQPIRSKLHGTDGINRPVKDGGKQASDVEVVLEACKDAMPELWDDMERNETPQVEPLAIDDHPAIQYDGDFDLKLLTEDSNRGAAISSTYEHSPSIFDRIDAEYVDDNDEYLTADTDERRSMSGQSFHNPIALNGNERSEDNDLQGCLHNTHECTCDVAVARPLLSVPFLGLKDYDHTASSCVDCYLQHQLSVVPGPVARPPKQSGPAASDLSSGEQQPHLDGPFSPTLWDSICEDFLEGYMARRTSREASPPNFFLPSMLTSCLNSEGAQLLQSAFVNSIFSTDFQEPAFNIKTNSLAIDCSDLENIWLSSNVDQTCGLTLAQYELIRGRTCSNWLENNCKLGLLCPFSHPSI